MFSLSNKFLIIYFILFYVCLEIKLIFDEEKKIFLKLFFSVSWYFILIGMVYI